MNTPDEPAPWLHPHPSEQGLHSYYGPVRQRAPHRYSVPSVAASARSLSRPQNCAQVDVSTLAFSRSVQEPQTRLTPPLRRAPPGQYTGTRQAHPGRRSKSPGFDAICNLRRLNGDAHRSPGRALLERLPGPHLTRSSRAFSLSLTTTVFSQRSTGRFSACPRRPTLEGQQSSISRTAPPMKSASYMTPPSAFVTHPASRCSSPATAPAASASRSAAASSTSCSASACSFVLVRIPFWAKQVAFGGRGAGTLRLVKAYVTAARSAR